MRVCFRKQMLVAAGLCGALAGSAIAAPPPSTSAPTVAQPSAAVAAPAAASSPQFFGTAGGSFSSTPIGPTHPDYWTGTYSLGGYYGLGGVLNPGYWVSTRPGNVLVAGGAQSPGAPPKGAIVAGGATAGLHFAGAAPGGVIVAGGPAGGVQSAGAAPGGVIVAGGPAGGVQSAGGVIVSGGTTAGTNAARAQPH